MNRQVSSDPVVGVELHYLDVPVEELIARVERRQASLEWTASPITREHMERWASAFEPPGEDERRLFDEPLTTRADADARHGRR